MGNVHDGVVNTGLQEEFKCCNVYAKEKCRDCFARFYCSGGCAANAYNFHGDILKTYETGCELQKKACRMCDHDKSSHGRTRRLREEKK